MIKANLRSDNNAGVCPEILEAMIAEAHRKGDSYGRDSHSTELNRAFSELFEREVQVIPVASGTAANALALRMMAPSYGMVLCSDVAHIGTDEAGAPEFFNAGCKLAPLPSVMGKLTSATVTSYLEMSDVTSINRSRPSVLSLTEVTERGTIYTVDEIASLCASAKAHNLSIHMDGARFANAVSALDESPADLTWRQGVDVLCFGATKNGAMYAEAIILFRPDSSVEYELFAKQSGHVLSKRRFISVQLLTMIQDGLWLKNGKTANAKAALLATRLESCSNVKIVYPVQANEVFFSAPPDIIDKLNRDGHGFQARPFDGRNKLVRTVAAFDTTEADIEAFVCSVASES